MNGVTAQELYAEIGQSISSFAYSNSSGGTLENLNSKATEYLSAGHTFLLRKEGLGFQLGGSIRNYGAIGSDPLLDNYFEWDVTYVGMDAGLSYEFYQQRAFRFYLRSSISLEYLLRGTQTLNNQVFNLSGEDEFENMLLVPRIGIGLRYPISNKAALNLTYTYGRSFSLTNSTPQDNEQLNINVHQIGLGISILLPGCNCAFNRY